MSQSFYIGGNPNPAGPSWWETRFLNTGGEAILRVISSEPPKVVDTHAVAAGGACMPVHIPPRGFIIEIPGGRREGRRINTFHKSASVGRTEILMQTDGRTVEHIVLTEEQSLRLREDIGTKILLVTPTEAQRKSLDDALAGLVKRACTEFFSSSIFNGILNSLGAGSGGVIHSGRDRTCPRCRMANGQHRPSCSGGYGS